MNASMTENDDVIRNYYALRQAIGGLGLALPFALAFGYLVVTPGHDELVRQSISSYYHTSMRDIMVGCLSAIGVFLLFYRGYDAIDRRVTNLAGIMVVLVAVCPSAPAGTEGIRGLISNMHSITAGIFFLALSYMSIARFTRSNDPTPTPEKLKRNAVYKTCGWLMFAAVVAIGALRAAEAFKLYDPATSGLAGLHPVFFLETIAILSFGFSWLTKGEAIFGDKDQAAGNSSSPPSEPQMMVHA